MRRPPASFFPPPSLPSPTSSATDEMTRPSENFTSHDSSVFLLPIETPARKAYLLRSHEEDAALSFGYLSHSRNISSSRAFDKVGVTQYQLWLT